MLSRSSGLMKINVCKEINMNSSVSCNASFSAQSISGQLGSEKRKRRSPQESFDYDDIGADYDDDIYALLALEDYDENDNLDYYDDYESNDQGDFEGSGNQFEDVDIDTATADMAENVNRILGLEKDELEEKDKNEEKNVSGKMFSINCESFIWGE